MERLSGLIRLSENAAVENLLVTAAIITAIVTVVTLIWKAVRPLYQRFSAFLDWQEEFRPQWEGYTARHPGDVVTPGVMERLSRIDGQFERNGGNSMKDSIYDLSLQVDGIAKGMEELKSDVQSLNKNMRRLHADVSKDCP